MIDINKIPQPIVIKSAPIAEIVRAFNIRNVSSLQVQKNQYEGKVQAFTPDKPLYLSPLGTPVMQDLTLGAATYTDRDTMQRKSTKPLTLINFLLRCSMTKKIVKTEIPGRNGTIKEFIGEDDWQITINGLMVADNGVSTMDEIISYKNILTANSLLPLSIPVVCTYLNNLDIFNIVIEDFTLEQDPGGYSQQRFTINALSDKDILLEIS